MSKLRRTRFHASALLLALFLIAPLGSQAQPAPAAAPLPVVLVPGIMGSELALNGHPLWPNVQRRFPCPLDQDALLRLQMLADGTPRVAGIVAPHIVDHPLARPYSAFIAALAGEGFRVFPFPYDWRRDAADTAAQLAAFVGRVRAETGASRIHLVAHSLGGLAAKAFVEAHPAAVQTLIFVAVPHLGTAKAFNALRYGDPLHPLVGLACGAQVFKRVTHNMPSLFHLLPSAAFFTRGAALVGDVRYFDEQVDLDGDGRTGLADPGRMTSILRQGKELLFPLAPADPAPRETLESSQLDRAAAFHDRQDAWTPPPGVNVYDIVGTNRAGIFRTTEFNIPCLEIGEQDRECAEATLRRVVVSSRPFGDGTVPPWSAEAVPADHRYWYDASRQCSLDRPKTCTTWNERSTPAPGESHATILQDRQIQQQILHVLRGRPHLLAGARLVDTPPSLSDRPWTTWSAWPSADLHLYDTQNRHTGPLPDGRIEEGIPDTYAERSAGTLVVAGSVPSVRVLLVSRQVGPLSLWVEESRGAAAIRVLHYRATAGGPHARAVLNYRRGEKFPALHADRNGEGRAKVHLRPTCHGLAAICHRGSP